MASKPDLVRAILSRPEIMTSFTLRDWDLLIRQARVEMLGRIHESLKTSGFLKYVPDAPRMHFEAARIMGRGQERIVRWEVYCIDRALASVQTDIVLLKGAAYILS